MSLSLLNRSINTLLTIQLLKSLSRSLRNQCRGENTKEHEQRKDLQNMGQPRGRSTASCALLGTTDTEGSDGSLGNDGTELTGGGGDTVGGGAVASGETFAGDDEGGGVRAEVEEELGEDVDCEEAMAGELVVGEAEDAEEDGLGGC